MLFVTDPAGHAPKGIRRMAHDATVLVEKHRVEYLRIDTRSIESLAAVIAAAREYGATHLFWNVLFLKPSAQSTFFPFLDRQFPHLLKRYSARFARSAFLDSAYKDRIAGTIHDLKRQHGFSAHPQFEMPAPTREAERPEAEPLVLLRIEPIAPSPADRPCVTTPPSSSS